MRYASHVLRETLTPVDQVQVSSPIAAIGGVYNAVSDCRRLKEEFTADGMVTLRIAVDVGKVGDSPVIARNSVSADMQLSVGWQMTALKDLMCSTCTSVGR